jgi:hypothetical protein
MDGKIKLLSANIAWILSDLISFELLQTNNFLPDISLTVIVFSDKMMQIYKVDSPFLCLPVPTVLICCEMYQFSTDIIVFAFASLHLAHVYFLLSFPSIVLLNTKFYE